MKYFTFFFLTIISAHIGSIRGLFRSVLDRIRPIWGCFSPFQTESDRIGPNWTVLENQKKKKSLATDAHAAVSTAARRVLAYLTWVRQPNRCNRASEMDTYSWVLS